VMGVVQWVANKTPTGLAANVASKMASKGDDAQKPSSFWDVIKLVAMFSLVLGAAMSIYIPLIPFITWIGAILAYAASMIEGFAGATLHAFSHLEADGDGLGQRTAHGYMFYINAVIRPALMVIGFFFASAIMIAIGTLQAQMFLPAMANVQGNSVTGLASVVMFLIVFFVMNMTLITASFNLIYVITDQVIGFVGGQIDSKLGRDTEDKVNNMFLMAARVGPSALGQANATVAKGRELLNKTPTKDPRSGNPG
jgi:conjugal transfer/type IV secretion protein DotA/TraY